VDGFNPPQLAEGALDRVIAEFDNLGKPHYHMIGNHELYNIPRSVCPSQYPVRLYASFLLNTMQPK
jgi:hypothetical protein